MMFQTLSRRSWIRIISFLLAVLFVLGASAISSAMRAARYRTQLSYTYEQALSDLTDYIRNIDTTLKKGIYCGTGAQMLPIASALWQESSAAKSSLAHLPISQMELGKTFKFLSQLGDYAITMTKGMQEETRMTEANTKPLREFSGYASQLSARLTDLRSDIEDGSLSLEQVEQVIDTYKEADSLPTVNSGFLEIEDGFSKFPALIYDGPFSDHIDQKKPSLTQGKAQVSEAVARNQAAKISGIEANSLVVDTPENGNMPSYTFQAVDLNVAVTKAGGYVSYLLNSRKIGEEKLTHNEAVNRAQAFLKKQGLDEMRERYFYTYGGIVTINFAATQEGYILYPDLIKVGVALDNGQIVSYDARGYILNHCSRTIQKPRVTEEKAKQAVSQLLTVKQSTMALIPSGGQNELYCYEFLCVGQNNEEVLVYINAQTGREEQILILLKSDGGTLTM